MAGGKNQQSKADKKKQQKAFEDKSFGLKNKKGASTQKQIKGMKTNMTKNGMSEEKAMQLEYQKKEEKKRLAEEQALMASLYGNITLKAGQTKKVVADDDSKKICQFFLQGLCQKGRKCKYSHDKSLQDGKMQIIDLYTDQREQQGDKKEEKKEDDTMENWDENKLKEVVEAQQKKYKSQKPTEIVCKYFLDAVNNGKYGWRWECPNGGVKCHYRHCLPQGFVLKKNVKKNEEDDSGKIEDEIDEKIKNLNIQKGSTKVTYEVFIEWKKKRDAKREKEREDKLKAKLNITKKKGPSNRNKMLTGLAMFVQDQSMFGEEDGNGEKDDIDYKKRDYEEEEKQNKQQEQQQIQEDDDEEEEQQQEEEEQKNEQENNNNQNNEQQQEEQKEQISDKKNENVPENWEDQAEDEEVNNSKKSKKKKKAKVEINDDVFLE